MRAGGDIVTGVLGQREAHYLNHDLCPVVSRELWQGCHKGLRGVPRRQEVYRNEPTVNETRIYRYEE